MSALGDYIHYRTENYRVKGVARPDEKIGQFYSGNAYNVVLRDRVLAMDNINEGVLNELKRRLKYQSVSQNAQDQIILNEKRETLTKALIDDMLKNYGTGIVGRYQATTENPIFKGSEVTKETLKAKGQMLYSQYNQLLDQIAAQNGRVNNQTLLMLNTVLEEMEGLTEMTDVKSIIGALNEFSQNQSYSNAYAIALGDFGEKYVGAVSDNIMNLTGAEVIKAIKESGIIKGKDTGEFNLDENSFSKEYVTVEAKDVMCKAYSTQNKTDAEITILGETIDASVKYYSNTKPTLQAQMNLVASLVYLNSIYEDFGNHWLNMHALDRRISGIKDADEALKLELAYEALVSGNPLKGGAGAANTFVYINRQTGDIQVYGAKSILSNKNTLSAIIFKPTIESINLKKYNRYVGNGNSLEKAQQRISNLIVSLHKMNVHAALKIDALSLDK